MKKKTALGILGAGLIIPTAFGLAGCSHDHKASAEWTMDSSNHWHVCSEKDCNEKVGVTGHTTKYVTVTEATSSEHGLALKSCGDCGYGLSNEFTTVHAPKMSFKAGTTTGDGESAVTTPDKYQISCGDSSCKEYYVQGSGEDAVVAQDMKKLDDNYIGTSAIKVPYTNLGNDIISFRWESNGSGNGEMVIAKIASDKTIEPYTIPDPVEGNGVTQYTYSSGNTNLTLNVKGCYATVSGNTSGSNLFGGSNGTVKCSIDEINDDTKLLVIEYMGEYAVAKISAGNALTLVTDAKSILANDATETAKKGTTYTLNGSDVVVYTQDGKSYANVGSGSSKVVSPCKVGNGTLELNGITYKVTTTTNNNKTKNELSIEKAGTTKYTYREENGEGSSYVAYFNVVNGKKIFYLTVEGELQGQKLTFVMGTCEWKELEDKVVLYSGENVTYYGYTLEPGVLAPISK